MKTLMTIVAAALFSLVVSSQGFAQGASQHELAWQWDPLVGQVDSIGKFITVQPAGRNKVSVTAVLEGALPDTVYHIGFNIFGPLLMVSPQM